MITMSYKRCLLHCSIFFKWNEIVVVWVRLILGVILAIEIGQPWFCFFDIIGLDNGLVPGRRETIAWTNNDPVQRRIYEALGEMNWHVFLVLKECSISY